MKVLGLRPEWAVFRDMWTEGLHMGKRLTIAQHGKNGVFKINDDDDDDDDDLSIYEGGEKRDKRLTTCESKY